MNRCPLLACVLLTLSACASSPADVTFTMDVESFGKTSRGEDVSLYVLTNGSMTVRVTNYGATLVNLLVPDGDGQLADVVLGFDDVSGYEGDGNQYFGCTVGRVANRIANASFSLHDKRYELAKNDGEHHLHGGLRGWDKQVWEVESAMLPAETRLIFTPCTLLFTGTTSSSARRFMLVLASRATGRSARSSVNLERRRISIPRAATAA